MALIKKKLRIKNGVRYKKYFIGKFLYLKKESSSKYRKTYFLNCCVSKHVYKNVLKKKKNNQLNLKKLFSNKTITMKYGKIDIIIPIYNGYEYLESLFKSIKETTDVEYQLIVINDCSTDERIKPLLKEIKKAFGDKMFLLENNENLGFVKTVNIGLSYSLNNVVLLNSDVILPKNWASRLLYPIIVNENVASVTPFSNAATIFSLPEISKDNIFKDDLEVINKNISKLNIPYTDITFMSGVGFCMAMNKKAIDDVGYFDEIFEKGYGEENDWCQRAINKGFINTIAGDLFVWHKHGGSFQTKEKQDLIKKHLNIIKKRYPRYEKDIGAIFKESPYMSLHFFAELLYFNSIAVKTQVWFDHTWQGGTEVYTFNKFNELKKENLCIRIQNDGSEKFILSYVYKDYENEIIILDVSDIYELLQRLSVDLLVVNNLASFKNILEFLDNIKAFKIITKAKVSFRGHDLQCICPTITMLDADNKYCNCKNTNQCETCFEKIKNTPIKNISNIMEWQSSWNNFLKETVDEIIVFSESTRGIFNSIYPEIQEKISIIPHEVKPLRKVNIPAHNTLNIGVLGSIGIHKGSLVLQEIDSLLKEYPNIKIKIIGISNVKKYKRIKILGEYEFMYLPKIIENNKIDIIFIPSIWPETFSYTTSEAISMGLPVACFDIGAPAERVRNYDKGIIIKNLDAQCALETISKWNKKYQEENTF